MKSKSCGFCFIVVSTAPSTSATNFPTSRPQVSSTLGGRLQPGGRRRLLAVQRKRGGIAGRPVGVLPETHHVVRGQDVVLVVERVRFLTASSSPSQPAHTPMESRFLITPMMNWPVLDTRSPRRRDPAAARGASRSTGRPRSGRWLARSDTALSLAPGSEARAARAQGGQRRRGGDDGAALSRGAGPWARKWARSLRRRSRSRRDRSPRDVGTNEGTPYRPPQTDFAQQAPDGDLRAGELQASRKQVPSVYQRLGRPAKPRVRRPPGYVNRVMRRLRATWRQCGRKPQSGDERIAGQGARRYMVALDALPKATVPAAPQSSSFLNRQGHLTTGPGATPTVATHGTVRE